MSTNDDSQLPEWNNSEEYQWLLLKKLYIEELFYELIYCNDNDRILATLGDKIFHCVKFISTKSYPLYGTPTINQIKDVIESLRNLGNTYGYRDSDIIIFMPLPIYRFSLSFLKELPKNVKYSEPNLIKYDYERKGHTFFRWDLESSIATHRDQRKYRNLSPSSDIDIEREIMRNIKNGNGDLHGL